MERSGSGRRVWAMSVRVGGLIGVVGLLALLFALSGAFERAPPIRPAASDANEPPALSLGGMDTVAGSSTVRLSLYREEQRGFTSVYGKDAPTVVNHLFRGVGGDLRWLYPGSGQIIVRTEAVSEPAPGRDGAPASLEANASGAVKAFVYEVVRQDSDKDGQFTRRDRRALAVSAPDGSRLTEVLSGFERVEDLALAGPDLLVIHLRRDGRDYLAPLDLRTFRLGPLEAVVPPR